MSTGYEGFAILELFGHRRLGGHVSEAEIAGEKLLRIDVPAVDDKPGATQFYGGKAIYALTPCDEETALRVARGNRPEPVQLWQLPGPAPESGERMDDDNDDEAIDEWR